jgi:hypothetical protein
MKRTILDIDGVFQHESALARPDNLYGGSYAQPPAEPESDEHQPMGVFVPQPKIDLSALAGGSSLSADAIEEMMTGQGSADSVEKQALADSMMIQMSPEDRRALMEMAKAGK